MLQDAKVVYVANLEGLNAAQIQIFLEDKHLKTIILSESSKNTFYKKQWNKLKV